LRRFRKRCGYGVHSPFAFDLITNVIYEKDIYNGYLAIEEQISEARIKQSRRERKINRLLFRLANRFHPQTIVESKKEKITSLYLCGARRNADFFLLRENDEVQMLKEKNVDFVVMYREQNVDRMNSLFESLAGRTTSDSVFIICGIGHSRKMKKFWQKVKTDSRVGITFDLYDIGILLFDKKKIKQDYIVNF